MMVAVPVAVSGRLIGALFARGQASQHFSSDDVQALALIAAQVGPAIESARLLVEAQRRRAEAEALAEIMSAGAIDRDPDRVIAMICDRACQLIGADYAGIVLVEADGSRVWRGMSGNRTETWRTPVPLRTDRSRARRLPIDRVSVIHRSEDDADDSGARMQVHRAEGGRTLLSVPISHGTTQVGALVLGWRSEVEPSDAQIQFAETLANYAALIVDNMRTRARERDAAREARARAAELAVSEERLRTLYEALSCGVMVKDREGRVIHVNAAAEEIVGYRFEAMRGRTTDELWEATSEDGSPLPSEGRASALAVRTGHPVRKFAACITRPDGEQRWLHVDSVPVYGPDGELIQVVSSFIDITERKLMEERLLRAQRLETAGRIAGQVAHDFNNLLAPLVGYPELIKMRLPPDHPALAFCDAMVEGARQIASINEDLLTLGRRGQFDYAPIDLNAVARAAVEREGQLPSTLSVQLELASDLLPLSGSAPQLQRALVNLLTNAREAMGDVGTLTIRTGNAYVDQPIGHYARVGIGEYVTLAVEDTGPGIRPEVGDRIFDAFFTTKVIGRRRGSGLGLSVVEAIVEDHGGHVDYESEPGKGTRFTLYFPPSRESVTDGTPGQVRGGDETVLIVDDDVAARELTRELLTALGYTALTAMSGEEALAMLKRQPADLLILDMVMPDGIDGTETYRRALELHPSQRAIVLSGFAEGDRTNQARALGVSGFLRKPVRMETLAQAVRAALDANAKSGHASPPPAQGG
jgi:PAS domain S-box-containing protein